MTTLENLLSDIVARTEKDIRNEIDNSPYQKDYKEKLSLTKALKEAMVLCPTVYLEEFEKRMLKILTEGK